MIGYASGMSQGPRNQLLILESRARRIGLPCDSDQQFTIVPLQLAYISTSSAVGPLQRRRPRPRYTISTTVESSVGDCCKALTSAVRRSSGDLGSRSLFCSRGGPARVLGTRISPRRRSSSVCCQYHFTAVTHLWFQGQGCEHIRSSGHGLLGRGTGSFKECQNFGQV